MKKVLATILAAAAVAATASADDMSADVLVWYVDTGEASSGGKNAAFDTIKFWAVDSDNTKLGLGGLTYTGPEDLKAARYADLGGRTPTASSDPTISTGYAPDTATMNYYTDLSGFQYDNGYTFLMELYKSGNDNAVAWMEMPLGLSAVTEAITSLSNLEDSFSHGAGMAGNLGETMVPEPTSGLLLLMGGALLALRRRRA